MRTRSLLVVGWLCSFATSAAADPAPEAPVAAPVLPRDVGLDLGLSVVQIAYEEPIADHVTVALTGGIFGTYFLPWFGDGPSTKGGGFGVRVTWFQSTTGHGLYITPYARTSFLLDAGTAGDPSANGVAVTAGAFVGWAMPVRDKVDLRLGLGAQYIYIGGGDLSASTPFVGADIYLGYRLPPR